LLRLHLLHLLHLLRLLRLHLLRGYLHRSLDRPGKIAIIELSFSYM
jgi:hypothetical protein|tara:strand:- start:86 stop:223 length:138 start_codon:yes stop_codon:yes gene_type:complete